MRQDSDKLQVKLITFILSIAPLSVWAEKSPLERELAASLKGDCGSVFGHLLPTANTAAAHNYARLNGREISFRDWLLRRPRDWSRDQLMRWHKHDLPIIAMDDATPAKAHGLFGEAYGSVRKAQLDLLPPREEMMAELNGLLRAVESYPARKKVFMEETATLAARKEFLEDLINSGRLKNQHTFEIELPLAKLMDPPGDRVTFETEKLTFPTYVSLQNYLDEVSSKFLQRTRSTPLRPSETDQFALDQAIALKKLETYLHLNNFHASRSGGLVDDVRQLPKSSSIIASDGLAVAPNPPTVVDPSMATPNLPPNNVPGAPAVIAPAKPQLPDDLQQAVNQIRSLYVGSNERNSFRSELLAPRQAWEELRWLQLGSEVRSLFVRDIPRLADGAANSKILEFFKGLSPEEKRALGVSNVADAITIIGRTRWAGLVVALGGGITTTGGGAKVAWDFFIHDSKAQQACITASDKDDQFVECLQSYLQEKFPIEALQEILSDLPAFIDRQAEISDPRVRRVVLDLINKRQAYRRTQLARENARIALSDAIRRMLCTTDATSQAYETCVKEAVRDDAFAIGYLGRFFPPRTRSKLEEEHPDQFKSNAASVDRIIQLFVANKRDPEISSELTKIRENGARELANSLRKALAEAPEVKSVLEARYPIQFRNHTATIHKIFSLFVMDPRDEQIDLEIDSVSRGGPNGRPGPAPDLAEHITKALADRRKYRRNNPHLFDGSDNVGVAPAGPRFPELRTREELDRDRNTRTRDEETREEREEREERERKAREREGERNP
jgi:hypothetical protein